MCFIGQERAVFLNVWLLSLFPSLFCPIIQRNQEKTFKAPMHRVLDRINNAREWYKLKQRIKLEVLAPHDSRNSLCLFYCVHDS